jgi:hypothetical protein
MIANHVGANYPDKFGRYALGTAKTVNLSTAGNSVAVIPILGGTKYIVRQITVAGANASVATGNLTILTSNDGVVANAVSNNVVLANITSNVTFQDLGLTANTVTRVFTAPALFVKVNTGVAGTVDITVYGDVVDL